MEIAQEKGLLAQLQQSNEFTAGMIAHLFKWSQAEVILLDVLVERKPPRPV